MYHKTHLVTEHGKSRLHSSMNTLCVLVESLFTAIQHNQGHPIDFDSTSSVGFVNRALSDQNAGVFSTICFPLNGPVMGTIHGVTPGRIQFEFGTTDIPDPHEKGTFLTPFAYTVGPVFVEFFERHREWLEDHFVTRSNWPPLFNFASAVRNAISHGWRIKFITKKKPAPASWYHLSYSEADNGREIFGTDIEFGDVVLLMFEMSDELDKLGCPIDI